jgi:UDP-glucuronate decarboxylase
MAKNILIAGGAGFLGSHLCQRFLKQGDNIYCLDNFSTGSAKNIAPLLSQENFKRIDQDISESFDVKVDEVYNLACPASPVHYQRDPIQTLKTNFMGTLHLLEIARRNQAKFLQASTSEIYGDPEVHPQTEDYWGHVNPIGIRSCYDEGKRCAEALVFDFWRKYKARIKVVRIFNTYGPRMHREDGRVVSNFIVQALRGDPMTIYGSGDQTRSFCYVDDLVEGMVRMMDTSDEVTGPVNLGNPAEIKIGDLAGMIMDLTRSSSKIVYKSLPQDDPVRRRPDISLARKLLRWEPSVSLAQGLVKTIDYFKSQ